MSKTAPSKQDFTRLDIDDQVDLINAALEPQVYPALQMDGGGMEIMDVEDTRVLIRYYGACGGCPIGATGTLDFIEHTLKTEIDPRITVEVV